MTRTERVLGWSGVLALIGLLVSAVTGAIAIGRRDAAIDQKVDRTEYQKDQTAQAKELGDMHGDIRVIRAVVCEMKPGACR